MPANGLNLFLLIASIFEILLLQIGYVRSAQKIVPKKAGHNANASAYRPMQCYDARQGHTLAPNVQPHTPVGLPACSPGAPH